MIKLNLFTCLILISAITFAGCKKEDIINYQLNITTTNGTVVKNPAVSVYKSGASVQLTATPNQGYTFSSWSGDAIGSANPLTIAMNSDKNITANFTAIINTYTLNVTATNGIVAKDQNLTTYNGGTNVLLTVTPNPGYIFASWGGDATGTANPLTVTMNGNKNITANFTAINGQVVNVKNTGAKGDGVTDDTAALQAAVDQVAGTGGTVSVPTGTYMINAITHLNLKSNMNLIIESGAILKAIPNGSTNYAVLQLGGVSNVGISGGKIEGERVAHTGTTGEWGFGIGVLGSDHVTITGTTVTNCWGDGFYIGANGTTPCSVIRLTNVIADNNRRQGMSIIHVNDMIVTGSTFKNTNGTAPQAGIDIEPNANNTVNDVHILNCQIIDNYASGISLWLGTTIVNAAITNIEISGNTVDRNRRDGGITVVAPGAYTITNNLIRNNYRYGLIVDSNGSTITGNTITFNGITGGSGWGVDLRTVSSNNTVTGNTIQNNQTGQLRDTGTKNNTTSPPNQY
ncbi:MAG: right-handed parallel beta-helix repeat-containing protein [Prolixibacteraceae bacterium]|jgi:uncharacterized repeat protein (TIGR02543 family)|nr:right-handed parallel beta-helix repeat-containing protein [Prolixibacteraceae bacterium]